MKNTFYFLSLLVLLASCSSFTIYTRADEPYDNSLPAVNVSVLEAGAIASVNNQGWKPQKPKGFENADIVCDGIIDALSSKLTHFFLGNYYADYVWKGKITTKEAVHEAQIGVRADGSCENPEKRYDFRGKVTAKPILFMPAYLEDNPVSGIRLPARVAEIKIRDAAYPIVAVYEDVWISIKKNKDGTPADSYRRTTGVSSLMQLTQKYQIIDYDNIVLAELHGDSYKIYETVCPQDVESVKLALGIMHTLLRTRSWLDASSWPLITVPKKDNKM